MTNEKKEDLRVIKTHKLLCDALFDLLKEKSFENIKLNEICKRAMVHKTTFYNHFEDKYDLLKYALLNLQKELLQSSNYDEEENIIDYYCTLAKTYMNHIKKNKNVYKSLISYNKDSIGMQILYNNFKGDVENRLKKEKEVLVPVNYISNYYVSGVFAVILEWFINGMKESEDEMINYLKILIGTR